jgi:hypothetical protein
VGWVLERTVVSTVLGALFAGGVGLLLAVMKHLFHCHRRLGQSAPDGRRKAATPFGQDGRKGALHCELLRILIDKSSLHPHHPA